MKSHTSKNISIHIFAYYPQLLAHYRDHFTELVNKFLKNSQDRNSLTRHRWDFPIACSDMSYRIFLLTSIILWKKRSN